MPGTPLAARVALVALAFSLGLASCTGPGPAGFPDDGGVPDARSPEREALRDTLRSGQSAVVLLVEGEVPSVSRPGLTASALGVSAREGLAELVPAVDRLLEARMLPIVAVRVRSLAQLDAIAALPGIVTIEPDRAHLATSAAHLELIGQPVALARGADGRGLSVAVLDTGADFTRPELGGCTAAGPDCPVAFARDFAPDDGALDGSSRHGTNVAGIVHLVAPAARILALDVFTGEMASSVDLIAALDWVIAHRDTYAIVSVNLSVGYGSFSSPCPTNVLAVALQRVRDAGILPVAATGNAGELDAITSPGCAPAALSVGAVDDSDAVASFSSSAPFVSLLAPGVAIRAGGLTMSGTSQATPHVAGAVAVVRSAFPSDDATATAARLVATGVPVLDARNGVTLPRLALDAATVTVPPPSDTEPPTAASVLLADGASWTRSTHNTLTLAATDPGGVTSMCVSTSASCTAWSPFSSTATTTLASGSGLRTVYAWFRDGYGNATGSPVTDTIRIDTAPPSNPIVLAMPRSHAVRLVFLAATDPPGGSGLSGYRVALSAGPSSPSCDVGTVIPLGAPRVVTFPSTPGLGVSWRVCAVDAIGNVSTGRTGVTSAVR